jgi:outer membrane protein insertion porin family
MYKLVKVSIENLDSDVSADLAAEAGTNTVSAIGFTMTRDSTDSHLSPTKGLVLGGGADFAGTFLGGDKDFYRLQGRANYYIPLKFESVLEFRTRAGFVDAYGDSTKVPIFERFFAGGARSIRGYNERKVGPLDSNTNDPIGGEGLFTAGVEYTIPIIDFIKLAAFLDTGNVWAQMEDFGSTDLKSGTGLGFRVKTPIGPVNLDYGYPLNDEPGEEDQSGKFYFSISRGF